MESNKEAAVSFLNLAAKGLVDDAKFRNLLGPDFKHHNPHFEGSGESLFKGMAENAVKLPNKKLEVKRVIADSNLVVTHSHVRPFNTGEPGIAVVHIFRFENGRIVELWDVGEEIPASSPNQYPMF
jgi:predicted SnoaL-like aldol condensation-catalyzing enzyme